MKQTKIFDTILGDREAFSFSILTVEIKLDFIYEIKVLY